MMKKEFWVGQSNELIMADKVFDLHNLYDFVGIVLERGNRRLRIVFAPNPEYGKGNVPISVNFEAIDYLEFSPNFGSRAVSGLDEMGYKNPNDRDDEWLLTEQQSTPDDHMFFRLLEGDDFIRVHCQYAYIVEATDLTSLWVPGC